MESRMIASLLALLLLAGCQADEPIALGSLIQRHADARGGEEAIEAIQSLRLELEITEPGFTVRADYAATRDGYMRIDIFSGNERVFTEALGPDGGWQLLRAATVATDLSQDGEKALQRGRVGNLYGLHELPGLGYELSLAGALSRDGEDLWAIDQVTPDGLTKRLFLDYESYLIVSEIETSALHPDMDSTKTQQETRYSDLEATAGVLFPRLTEKTDFTTGEVVQTVVVRNVEVNPAIDKTMFDRPDESMDSD